MGAFKLFSLKHTKTILLSISDCIIISIKNTDEVLLIAIEKSKIDFLKILCNNVLAIRVKSIGIDQFAAEVKYLYPEDYTENNILLTTL